MSKEINEGLALIIKSTFELISHCLTKKKDARRAVEQDIAANEFRWDEEPRSWWQSRK